MQPLDAVLTLGATMRLSRLVVADDLGQWWVKDPIQKRAVGTKAEKYAEGLDCPFCVGFWIGAATLATTVLTQDTVLAKPWRFVMGALALNEVAAHAGAALGDTAS